MYVKTIITKTIEKKYLELGLSKELSPNMPKYISIGPNMKKMMESGEMDRDELEERLSQMGIIYTETVN